MAKKTEASVTDTIGKKVYISKFALDENIGIFEAIVTQRFEDNFDHVFAHPCDPEIELPDESSPDPYFVGGEYHKTRDEAVAVGKGMLIAAIEETGNELIRLCKISLE